MKFKFIRDGKEILNLSGHVGTVFRDDGDTLYFADFPPDHPGCTVCAYDLLLGKAIWQTKLKAVPGAVFREGYRNRVTLGVGKDFVVIQGNETGGDYMEFLDRKAGKKIAYRLYRNAPE